MDVTYLGIALVPLIVGLVEVVKRAVGLPASLAPLVAVAIGLALAYLVGEGSVAERVVTGLALGLSAVGLYSSSRNLPVPRGE